ncbi:hypothetical protein Dsin_001504 [Dipteronia sinensis]|uniref:DUF4283 domain-containing protein n=1 Tax=Dipteronia sinensis TaxID=43782 RepID=A0AAE0B4X2_9ROSI|nr:hypothetical protein Dsin_001504 [Dipteronia sinensis]
MCSLHLKLGILRLQPWVPDFNPAKQKSTNIQAWVRFYDLSWEYWHSKIISNLHRGIGVPLRLDRAIVEGDFGHFTLANSSWASQVDAGELEANAQVVLFHQQFTVSLSVNSRLHWYTFFYTSTSAIIRRSLWQSLRDLVSLVTFSWMGEDHCPLLIWLSDIEVSSPKPFRFQSMWLAYPDFMAIVHRIWSSPSMGNPHQLVINKLKSLNKALKTWNWEVFDDLYSNITRKSAELQFIQHQMSNLGFSKDFFDRVTRSHEFDVLLHRHECYLLDQSRVKWLHDGDQNSSSFHASIRRRQC